MFKFITLAILIGVSTAGFVFFTNPLYKDVLTLRSQTASYNEALNNSKSLENERDKLTKKYNTINPENLVKIAKLLPDNVDNIRLILEIEKVALPYGMVLRDVKYDNVSKDAQGGATQGDDMSPNSNREYGIWDLEFSTSATYNNFINFVKDLEKNLRIVDISAVNFSSEVGTGVNPSFVGVYNYQIKIKTYWLKN